MKGLTQAQTALANSASGGDDSRDDLKNFLPQVADGKVSGNVAVICSGIAYKPQLIKYG